MFDQCRGYLLAQAAGQLDESPRPQPRAVTISRETGAGAVTISELLLEYLETHGAENKDYPWAVFDHSLVKRVLADHQLPETLESYLPEDAAGKFEDILEDILNIHPPTSTLIQHVNETILKLALLGNVILVGRGANLVTSRLNHVLHVRLIAPYEQRVKHIAEYYCLSPEAAAVHVLKSDRARVRYIRQNFGVKIQDFLQFDLTINTGRISFEEAARIIGEAVLHRPAHHSATN